MKTYDLQNHPGPLIGILAGNGKNRSVVGNGPFFKELQKEILKDGGLSVVFTPIDINEREKEIKGFVYSPEQDQWSLVTCPLPHVVFNRVPFRSLESTDSFRDAYHYFQRHRIPFFNPSFLNKYELFQILSMDPILQSFLPDTTAINEDTSLQSFLEKHQRIYLKPIYGAKGKGIYMIRLSKDQTIRLNALTFEQTFKDFHAFWKEWGESLLKKIYIAQEAIEPSLFQGKRYDFRVLAHFSEACYQVTGIGVRQAGDQEITTHIPNGGCLIPYKGIQSAEHDLFFAMIVKRAGELLSKEKGFFAEFSIDAGISVDGKYVLYEINSKPMRFDEPEIEEKRLRTLSQMFMKMASNH